MQSAGIGWSDVGNAFEDSADGKFTKEEMQEVFDAARKEFECPCHKSGFAIDGKKLFGPSRRGLDQLPVKLETKAGAKEILVKFERFKGGIAEKKVDE